MTPTATPEGSTHDETPTARRRLTSRGPIWVRVSVITGLLLVGVFLSTMLLAAAGVGDRDDSGGGHGTDQPMEMNTDDGSRDHGSGGAPGSGDDGGSGADHGSSNDRNSGHDAGDQTG
jgi:hypothetical protein